MLEAHHYGLEPSIYLEITHWSVLLLFTVIYEDLKHVQMIFNKVWCFFFKESFGHSVDLDGQKVNKSKNKQQILLRVTFLL